MVSSPVNRLSLPSLLITLGVLCGLSPAAAQSPSDGSVTIGDGHTLRIGGLVQTDAYLAREETDVPLARSAGSGFRARSVRVRLGGETQRLSYVVQTELTSSSVLLDALARVPLTDRIRLSGGLFKTPYSAEILKGRPDLLFAERARVVNALAPARQAGATLSASLLPDGRLTATIGSFNGTTGLQGNDNDLLLHVGRLATAVPVGPTQLNLGVNAAYSIDDQVTVAERQQPFSGRRILVGGDASLQSDRWLLEGEVHVADLVSDRPDEATSSPFGYYVAGGATVAPRHQFVVRYGYFDSDVPRSTGGDNVTLGYNFDVSSTLRAQLNYRAPVDDADGGFATARLQVAF